MNRTHFLVVAAAALAACVPVHLRADTLFSQPSNSSAFRSTYDISYSGSSNIYDDFTFATTSTITSVLFEGSYLGIVKPTFTVNIYSSVNGKPGTQLATNSLSYASLAITSPFSGDYIISAALSPFVATAGTKYFLSIVGSSSSKFGWAESDSGGANSLYSSKGAPTTYLANGSNLAFTLSGTPVSVAPEPSALMLVGTGLMAFAGAARLRYRRSEGAGQSMGSELL